MKKAPQVQVLDHPGELKVGYTPVCFVRTGRSAVRMKQLIWKMGKETGGKKMEEPHCLKANEMAEVMFVPQQGEAQRPSWGVGAHSKCTKQQNKVGFIK